ncbi:MAG: ArsC family reductase [Mariprofundaceae bacterium]|nr:ArsC family reductase [Mariprofundaceae bacterium]
MSRVEGKIEMFGIPNCDTIKKARRWLQAEGVEYQFHDYKKEGVDASLLSQWCAAQGWEVLLNRRGTTWRKLPDSEKEGINELKAIELMVKNPSMIKRPVLIFGDCVTVGFSPESYQLLFS